MLYQNYNKSNSDENLFRILISRLLPYWHLFLTLLIIGLIGAWTYVHFATSIYEISASLIIKDEKKGVGEKTLLDGMDPFDSKKIVENEIEVIQSRALMQQVVGNLHLHAPIFEEQDIKTVSAYSSSPIKVIVENPEKIPSSYKGDPPKYYFTYDSSQEKVNIKNKDYPLGGWIENSIVGRIKFEVRDSSNVQSTDYPLYYTFTNPKAIVTDLLDGLEVQATNKLSSVVRLNINDPVPARGEDILNELMSVYNQRAISSRNLLATNTLDFIEERMSIVEKELEELETDIQLFRSEKGVVDLSEQGKLYLQNIGQYDRQISEITRQLGALENMEKYVISKKAQSGIVPSTSYNSDPVLNQLIEKLYNSEIEYEKLKRTTAENNPMLIAVSNEIEKIRPSILENIQSQKNNLRSSLGNLNYNSNQSNSALRSIPKNEKALLEITRSKAIKNDLYAFLQKKREETALSSAPQEGDGRIVDMAESSLYKVSPKPIFAFGLAFVLAFGLGLLYISIKENLNSKVLFRSEIESMTNIEVISELPYLKSQKSSVPNPPKEALLLEHFLQIGAKLGLYNRHFVKQKILITSSIAGEGKSFVSSNLAFSLAQAGKRVLLLDSDFIKPNTTRVFKLSDKPGLFDYLTDKVELDEIINKSESNKNLSVIPIGLKKANHTAILLNGKIETFFEQLSNKFDYILMDTAPVELIPEVNLLAQFSDKTLFVIKHGYTPINVINHLEASLKPSLLKKMSIVFNGIKKRGLADKNFGYGYGYGYGYSPENVSEEIVWPKT